MIFNLTSVSTPTTIFTLIPTSSNIESHQALLNGKFPEIKSYR